MNEIYYMIMEYTNHAGNDIYLYWPIFSDMNHCEYFMDLMKRVIEDQNDGSVISASCELLKDNG